MHVTMEHWLIDFEERNFIEWLLNEKMSELEVDKKKIWYITD